MAQVSSAARPLPEEQPTAVETAERKPTPERAERPVEKVLEGGSPEKIVSIFQGRAAEEKQAMERLGLVEPEEAEAVPEAAARVAEMTEQTRQKIDQVTSTTLMKVQALLGTPPAPANENVPAEPRAVEAPIVEAVKTMPVVAVGEPPKAEAVPIVETVKVAPTVAVGEIARTEQEASVEKSEEALEADEQLEVAAEVMKENYEALAGFAKEHGLPLNEEAFQIAEKDLTKLTKPERMYAQVLMGKHSAGHASMLHAEKLLEAYELPEGDPKRTELMEEAETLAGDAALREKGAQVMQQNYMNLPEIMALAAGGGGDDTGGSVGGSDFEAQKSPFGEKPNPPASMSVGGLSEGGVAPDLGVTVVKSHKTEGAQVEKSKPSWVDRFVGGNVGKIKDWFGQFGPDGKGRE